MLAIKNRKMCSIFSGPRRFFPLRNRRPWRRPENFFQAQLPFGGLAGRRRVKTRRRRVRPGKCAPRAWFCAPPRRKAVHQRIAIGESPSHNYERAQYQQRPVSQLHRNRSLLLLRNRRIRPRIRIRSGWHCKKRIVHVAVSLRRGCLLRLIRGLGCNVGQHQLAEFFELCQFLRGKRVPTWRVCNSVVEFCDCGCNVRTSAASLFMRILKPRNLQRRVSRIQVRVVPIPMFVMTGTLCSTLRPASIPTPASLPTPPAPTSMTTAFPGPSIPKPSTARAQANPSMTNTTAVYRLRNTAR